MYIGIKIHPKSRLIAVSFSDVPTSVYPFTVFLKEKDAAKLIEEKLREGFRFTHITLGDEFERKTRVLLAYVIRELSFSEIARVLENSIN